MHSNSHAAVQEQTNWMWSWLGNSQPKTQDHTAAATTGKLLCLLFLHCPQCQVFPGRGEGHPWSWRNFPPMFHLLLREGGSSLEDLVRTRGPVNLGIQVDTLMCSFYLFSFWPHAHRIRIIFPSEASVRRFIQNVSSWKEVYYRVHTPTFCRSHHHGQW